MNRQPLGWLVAAAMVLTACGTAERQHDSLSVTSEIAVGEVGECVPGAPGYSTVEDQVPVDAMTLDTKLRTVVRWYVFADASAAVRALGDALDASAPAKTVESLAQPLLVSLDASAVLVPSTSPAAEDDAPDALNVDRYVVMRAHDALLQDSDGSLFLGAVGEESTPTATAVIADQDSVQFIGHCHRALFTEPLLEFFAESGKPVSKSSFAEVAVDPSLLVDESASSGDPSQSWWGQPESVRLLNSDTPSSILDDVDDILVAFEFPSFLVGQPFSICTRLPGYGWGLCRNTNPLWSSSFLTYGRSDRPLELWLLRDPADVTLPVAQIGEASRGLMAELIASDGVLLFSLDGGSANLEVLTSPEYEYDPSISKAEVLSVAEWEAGLPTRPESATE